MLSDWYSDTYVNDEDFVGDKFVNVGLPYLE